MGVLMHSPFSKNIYLFKMKTLRDFIKESKESPLYEMAGYKEDYEGALGNQALNLYNHLLYICSIGYIEPYLIPHWCSEILQKFTPDIASFKFKSSAKNTNRGECVQNKMMRNLMGIDFEDYDIDDYINAVRTEKNKVESDSKREENRGSKALHDKRVRTCDSLLRNNNLEKYVTPNKSRLVDFYKALIDTANTRNPDGVKFALNTFVDNAPGIE